MEASNPGLQWVSSFAAKAERTAELPLLVLDKRGPAWLDGKRELKKARPGWDRVLQKKLQMKPSQVAFGWQARRVYAMDAADAVSGKAQHTLISHMHHLAKPDFKLC